MKVHAKWLLAALAAALALSVGTGTAVALRSLSLQETRLTLTGRFTAEAGIIRIRCNVTVVKTLNRTIPKVEETLIGHITEYRMEACAIMEARELNGENVIGIGQPETERWSIYYKAFLGTLPRITGILIEWRRMQKEFEITTLEEAHIFCVYENIRAGTLGMLAEIAEGIIGRLRTLERPQFVEKDLERLLSSPRCPERMRLRYELTPSQRTRVTLV